MSTSLSSSSIDIGWRGRTVRIEHQWLPAPQPDRPDAPLIVFLHEGLGSVAMWRDFPARLCAAAGARGLLYSRPGYGRSTPRSADEAWGLDYLHQQAHELLPALLAALGVDAQRDPPLLFGHSDGGSLALLYAARFPTALRAAVVMAPHIMVEDLSLAGIRQTRQAYLESEDGGLRARLARYHDDPDSAFFGWADIWLHPPFAHWSIESEIAAIRCPLLAIQGVDDEYGTLEQIRGIARRVPQARLLEIARCGHSPQRDQPQAVIDATCALLRG